MVRKRRGRRERRGAAACLWAGAAYGLLCTSLACRPAQAPKPPAPAAATVGDPSGPPARAETARKRQRPPPQPVHDREAAFRAVASGNHEGAVEFLQPFVDEHPDDVSARLQLARGLWNVGAYERTLEVLTAQPTSATQAEPFIAAARLQWFLGQPAAAEDLMRRVLADAPDHIPARGELLWILSRTGRGDQPEANKLRDDLYDAYDAGRTTEAADLLAVARAALSRGSSQGFHDANMVLGEAEERAPVASGEWIADRIRLQRADIFLEKYAGSEAADTYSMVLERDEWNPEALVGLASVHLDTMRFSDALERAREALQVDARHPDAHAVTAYVALVEGRRETAREVGEGKILAVNRLHPEGLAILGALAILENDQAEYERWRTRALELDPRGSLFYRAIGDLLSLLHLYGQTDEVLREATTRTPEDPYLQSAYGINLLRLGQETAGLAALELAWKGDPFNVRTQNILDLYEQRIRPHYVDVRIGDLTLRLPKEDQQFVQPEIIEAVRRASTALNDRYHMDPGPLRLEFFATPEDFSIRTMGVPSLGAIGVCFGNVVTFVGPYGGQHNLHGVVWHEMAHVYAIKKSKGRVPRWFTEGLSEWESELADPSWARESARLLLEARKQGKLRPLGELEQAFIRADSGLMMEAAYATSAYAVRFLGETFGLDTLIAMLEGYAEGLETEVLVKRHLGRDIGRLEQEFDEWLVAHLEDIISGWQPSRTKAGNDPRDRMLRQATQAYKAREYDRVQETLESLIARGGDGFETRMLAARASVQAQDPDGARVHLDEARKFDREAIAPWVLSANIAHEKGDLAAEKDYLRQALALDGDAFDPAARLLMLSEVTKDPSLREVALDRAAAIAPVHPIVLTTRALDQLRAGASAATVQPLFQRAAAQLDGQRGPSDTYVMAALAASALGESTQAKAWAKVAMADPELPKPAASLMKRL